MQNYDLIVIGAGASGFAAAVNAARLHPDFHIAVLEKLPRSGKKILATGNGRCNLSNTAALSHCYTNAGFARGAFEKYGVDEALEFFASLGLLTYTDSAGRIYPASNTAASVLDALRFAAEELKIEVICEQGVESIERQKGGYCINGRYIGTYVIIAAGGRASPSQGSDGSGFELARSLGHTVTRLSPSLVPLCADADFTKQLKGVRIHRSALSYTSPNGTISKTEGEILFTDYGLSGIAAMELSGAVGQTSAKSVKVEAFTYIDFTPDMSEAELVIYLKKVKNIKENLAIDNLLTGIMPKPVGIAICKASELYRGTKTIKELPDAGLERLAKAIKHFPLRVTGTRGFDNAQVTRGGVLTDEIDCKTMQSKKHRNLYFAGEIIDVDGGCGGFNLQWAWSSGLLAGELGGNDR